MLRRLFSLFAELLSCSLLDLIARGGVDVSSKADTTASVDGRMIRQSVRENLEGEILRTTLEN